MSDMQKTLSRMLESNLDPKYTSICYAIMIDGEIAVQDALGNDGTKEAVPAKIEDTCNIASVSKMICTLAVMKLVEQGKVELDAPVIQYLPEFRMPDERYKKITLRHCLNHSSGLPGTMWHGFAVTDIHQEGYDYYEDALRYFAENDLKAEPGEFSVYCNDGFTLAEMVVAKVCGMAFQDFAEQYILGPIKADSFKTSYNTEHKYKVLKEKGKPREYLHIQGAGGYTANMPDLCRLGNAILHPSGWFSQESIDEMGKSQGTSFLENDGSDAYGLGWDYVTLPHNEYDLGEQVWIKSGSSFAFATQFIVLPKYDAVLAISGTHDCNADIREEILRMFAILMLERDVNIFRTQIAVPDTLRQKYAGDYFAAYGLLNVDIIGPWCQVTDKNLRGDKYVQYKNLRYNGTTFEGNDGTDIYFAKAEGRQYLMAKNKFRTWPVAQKVEQASPLSGKWKDRLGKQYICCSIRPEDIVIHQYMSGFVIKEYSAENPVAIASFSGDTKGDPFNLFNAPIKPVSDDVAESFLKISNNPGRDCIKMNFEVRNGKEYCRTASYEYCEADGLPEYKGEGFCGKRHVTDIYRINGELKNLPEKPEGSRIFVLNENMDAYYDSIFEEEYKPIDKGFLLLIS